jgi:inhibitor of cysteine peptidase
MTAAAGSSRLAVMACGLALACALALAACAGAPGPRGEGVGLPNPASQFCEQHGGTVEIREDSGGGQRGICVFADGSECDEWAFYRGECEPGT